MVERITVRDLCVRWEKLRQFTRSWRQERSRLDHVVRILGDRFADEITPEVWETDYRGVRLSEKVDRSGKRPKDTTLDQELGRAKQMLGWGFRSKLIPSNPLADAKKTAYDAGRETWLNWEQIERLLLACWENPFLYAWVLVAVSTGMRISESLTLRHDRIGGNGVVSIASLQTKSKRKRIVALSPRAMAAIRELPRHYSSPFVFWSKRTGKAIHSVTIEAWFRKAVERCGLDSVCAYGDKKLRPHDLRHSHASLADAAGASPLAIRDQLGHADLRTTQRYLHRVHEDRALEMAYLMDRKPPKKKVAEPSNEMLTAKRDRGFS